MSEQPTPEPTVIDPDLEPCRIRDCPNTVPWYVGPFCGEHAKSIETMVARKVLAESEAKHAARVVAFLSQRLPQEVWKCPDCGVFAGADEDGCCYACGQDLVIIPVTAALAAVREPEAGATECPACGGKGFQLVGGRSGGGRPNPIGQRTCPGCDGTGLVRAKESGDE